MKSRDIALSEASAVGLAAGLALATATAAPFPLANIPAHMAGIVSCKIAADKLRSGEGELRPAAVLASVVVATATSFFAFVTPSLLKVEVSTMVSNAILSPILYAGAAGMRSGWKRYKGRDGRMMMEGRAESWR